MGAAGHVTGEGHVTSFKRAAELHATLALDDDLFACQLIMSGLC